MACQVWGGVCHRHGDLGHHLGPQARIQPDVGVDDQALLSLQRWSRLGVDQGEHVERSSLRVADRVLDRRLESRSCVYHQVGGRDQLDIVGRELQIVRLHAGWREVHNVDTVAADDLSCCCNGVESSDDGHPPIVAGITSSGLGARTRCGEHERDEGRDRYRTPGSLDDSKNRSHLGNRLPVGRRSGQCGKKMMALGRPCSAAAEARTTPSLASPLDRLNHAIGFEAGRGCHGGHGRRRALSQPGQHRAAHLPQRPFERRLATGGRSPWLPRGREPAPRLHRTCPAPRRRTADRPTQVHQGLVPRRGVARIEPRLCVLAGGAMARPHRAQQRGPRGPRSVARWCPPLRPAGRSRGSRPRPRCTHPRRAIARRATGSLGTRPACSRCTAAAAACRATARRG